MFTIPTHFRTQAIVTHGDTHSTLTSPKFDLTATQSVFERASHAYTTGGYSRAVELYTEALDTVHANLASVILLHRAAAHDMMHDYDSALNDSEDADPDGNSPRPDAYFAKGNALTFQDRLRSAALVFKTGIDNVAVTDPARPQMIRRFEQLRAEMDRRNQWIMNALPYEVVSRILSKLSFKDRCKLSLTCRFWNNFVLQEWSPMWSSIDVHDMPQSIHQTDILLGLVPPDRVKKVKLTSTTDIETVFGEEDFTADAPETESGRIFKTMLERNWNHIASLEFSNISNLQMIEAIHLTKDTLTSLKLTNSNSVINHSIDAVNYAAQTCKSIQSIESTILFDTLVDMTNMDAQITLATPSLYLTQLQLLCPVPPATLARLLDHSPHLVSLGLDSISYPNHKHAKVLGTVYTHSPKLQELYYDYQFDRTTSFTATYSRPDVTATTNDGLQVLHFDSQRAIDVDTDNMLRLLLKRSCSTLERLFIKNNVERLDSCGSLAMLSKHGARRLQTLDLYISEDSTCKTFGPEQFSDLLAACPSLETVRLTGMYFWNDIAFQYLGKLLRLEHLEMCLLPSRQPKKRQQPVVSSNAIEALFNGTPNLRHFRLAAAGYDTDPFYLALEKENTLPCIATQIKSCPRINEFHTLIPFEDDQNLLRFLNELKDSQIRKLSIHVACGINELDLKALASIDNLEYLEVYDQHRTFTKKKLRWLLREHQSNRFLAVYIKYNHYNWKSLKGVKHSVLSADPSEENTRKRFSVKLNLRGSDYDELYDDDEYSDSNSQSGSDDL